MVSRDASFLTLVPDTVNKVRFVGILDKELGYGFGFLNWALVALCNMAFGVENGAWNIRLYEAKR